MLFVDGAHVYVGASAAPWGSRWPMGIPRLRMPREAPSRSTLKLAEALVTFLGEREPELLRAGMRAVDLGAAPGGWTWQLAHRGLRVTAVDNGPLKGEIAQDPLVTHLRVDGLTFRPRRPVDWMVCDIVEQPARIAALVGRWIGDGHARRTIFNLKLPMKKRYDEVRRCEAIIGEAIAKAGAAAHAGAAPALPRPRGSDGLLRARGLRQGGPPDAMASLRVARVEPEAKPGWSWPWARMPRVSPPAQPGLRIPAARRNAQRRRQACVGRSNRRVSSTCAIFTAAEVATMTIAIAAAAAVKPASSMLMIEIAASLVSVE